MALHIIIDGYNLIRQSNSLSSFDQQDIQLGREALIESLACYKRIKGHRITVVFDGIEAPEFSQITDRMKGIDIRFSLSGEQADAVIKRMASCFREKALVVTSDREIIHFVESEGATCLSSTEFEQKLIMASYHDIKGENNIREDYGWVPTTKKKGPKRRLSKKDRHRKIKLLKL